MKLRILLILLAGVAVGVVELPGLFSARPAAAAQPASTAPWAQASTAVAEMQPTPTSDRLAPWPTVYPPSQADTGAQEYYQRCMVCHGDRGQGLTAEWRGALDPADQDCWQSGCHNVRHPPGGFIFPKAVPAVIGPTTLMRFETAQELFEFMRATMPFQAPGSLSDEMYWQLTAYLLRENGFDEGHQPLDEARAGSLALLRQKPGGWVQPGAGRAWWLLAPVGMLALGWGVWWTQRARRAGRKS